MVPKCLTTFLSVAVVVGAAAAERPAESVTVSVPAIYFVLDVSRPMGELLDGDQTKFDATFDALKALQGSDFHDSELAVRVFGHRPGGGCTDSEWVIPFAKADRALAQATDLVDRVRPQGDASIGRSLRAARGDLGDRFGEVILISGGVDTCGDDPCALVRMWHDEDAPLRVNVVGLGLNGVARTALSCIAKASGARYHDAQTSEYLFEALEGIRARLLAPALVIEATNAEGDVVRVLGSASCSSGKEAGVANLRKNRLPPGSCRLRLGIQMTDATLYRPVVTTVEVAPVGETRLAIVVREPPSVGVRFVQDGNHVASSFIEVFQDGEKVVGFSPGSRTYLAPGPYEFRATVAGSVLSVTETIVHGEDKTVVFEVAPPIHP